MVGLIKDLEKRIKLLETLREKDNIRISFLLNITKVLSRRVKWKEDQEEMERYLTEAKQALGISNTQEKLDRHLEL